MEMSISNMLIIIEALASYRESLLSLKDSIEKDEEGDKKCLEAIERKIRKVERLDNDIQDLLLKADCQGQ